MRLIMCICFLCLGLSVSAASAGQDKTDKSETLEKAPTEKTAKPQDSDTAKTGSTDEPFDLDSFFKQGEENAEKGTNCEKAPEPVA